MTLRALLVGINAYPRLPLRGCVNDVEDLRAFLMSKCGFADQDIHCLVDADATAATIREMLRTWLVGGAASGDKILFHYSGHGSRLVGSDRQVHDIICPVDFDFNSQAQAKALSDLEFRAIFAGLPRDAELVWISDSCHSGNLASDERGMLSRGSIPRYMPPPPAVLAEINRIIAARGGVRSLERSVEHLRGVLLAGCQSEEFSYDALFKDRHKGAFSHHLLEQLNGYGGLNMGVDALLEATRKAVSQNHPQHPQLRGARTAKQKAFLDLHPVVGGVGKTAGTAKGTQEGSASSRGRAGTAARKARTALVIGNADYDDKLANPVRDAALICDTLKKLKFEVVGGAGYTKWGVGLSGQNLVKTAMTRLTDEFIGAIGPGSTAVIYYAGHGIQVGDVNFLVPIDATLTTDYPIEELVSLNDLIDRVSNRVGEDGKVFVFLDACRNNPFGDDRIEVLAQAIAARNPSAVVRKQVAQNGLAPWRLSPTAPARQFIAYATAPGDTASDGSQGDKNSPFALAIARNLGVRGLDINECFDRIVRDVHARSAISTKLQDPWRAANFKQPFFFEPMSWWPVLVLGLLGMLGGAVVGSLILKTSGNTIAIVSPFDDPKAWLAALGFAPALAAGTFIWGSGSRANSWWRGWRDFLFATVGSGLAFYLALLVLQLTRIISAYAVTQSDVVLDARVGEWFILIGAGSCALVVLGSVLCWERNRHPLPIVIDILLPVLLGVALFGLQDRLFTPKPGVSAAILFTALVAGVLFAAGTALALKPQRSVFRGFGAVTGSIAVGLGLPLAFNTHLESNAWSMMAPYALCALWFGVLGTQLGYCFAFYVPEYEPPRIPRRAKPAAVAVAPPGPRAKNFDDSRAIPEALADREAQIFHAEAEQSKRGGLEISPEQAAALAQRVSAKALALIVRHESGGRDYYENHYKCRPVWPEAKSGVTIGFGYDLGYQDSFEAVVRDWGTSLPADHLALLKPAVKICAVEPNRADKVRSIKAMVGNLVSAGVTIPWSTAQAVFTRVTIPRFSALTAAALPGHEALPPDCFGALVSLTFNRGASYGRPHDPKTDPHDRYREMREIRLAVAGGEFERVPGLIRAMKRIWQGEPVEAEMNRRRENEARLFEEGLAQRFVVADASAATAASRSALPTATAIDPIEYDDISAEELEGEAEAAARERGIDFPSEVSRSAAQVKWASDDKSVDYAHLDSKLQPGITFKLSAADLQYLAELNSFPVAEAGATPILFGLRGCAIVEGNDGEFSTEVVLCDQRPDHNTTRCVIGVWNRDVNKIAVFEGSTVPHKKYVIKWQETQKVGNMLPTGFYGYIVGPHTPPGGTPKPGCFLLRDHRGEKREVMVRRTKDNLTYERTDRPTYGPVGDNIHPTFNSGMTDFGSAGCQVVRGRADPQGKHSGPWGQFRRAAGLKTGTGRPGTPYLYMLLTGAEAMLAWRAREHGAIDIPEVRQSLMRLRFGSKGAKVSRLQRFLGVPASGEFDLATAIKLYELQKRLWSNASDGIFTPALDAELSAGVFAEKPVPEVVAAAKPEQTPVPPTTTVEADRPNGAGPAIAAAAEAGVVAMPTPDADLPPPPANGIEVAAAPATTEVRGSFADDLPDLADEDVLRGLPPDLEDADRHVPAARRAVVALPTEVVRLTIEHNGSNYFATDQHGDRLYVGKAVPYRPQNGQGISLYDRQHLYDRVEEEQRSGLWAHFLWPSIMAESGGAHITINSYDRAHFTWGLYQLAAHTADENLIVHFRELLKLPTSKFYFPDLTLHEGRVARIVDGGPITLERVAINPRTKEREIPDFMRYLNPSFHEVDEAEVINCAKFIHWAQHDPAMLATSMRLSLETARKKLKRLDRIFALTGRPPEVVLWVSDMYHQGRAVKQEVVNALALPTTSGQLRALSEIDRTGKQRSRCDTVRKHVAMLLEEKRFAGIEFGRGPLSLQEPAPSSPAPPDPPPVDAALVAAAQQTAASNAAS